MTVLNYGDAELKSHYDDAGNIENVTVERADNRIGISTELLANRDPRWLPIDEEGCILLAADPRFRYRATGECGDHPDVLIYERVPVEAPDAS